MAKEIVRKPRTKYAGILVHPSSLPGNSGIGDIGIPARKFVDFLHETKQTLWQILPLGVTGWGNSPYQCYSAFAGNPLLISLEDLVADGLLPESDLGLYPKLPDEKVKFESVIREKTIILEKAVYGFEQLASDEIKKEFKAFQKEKKWWLHNYSLFMSIMDHKDSKPWWEWDIKLKNRNKKSLTEIEEKLEHKILYYKLTQFFFYRQWNALKEYTNKKDIQIIGDIPIFVAMNSADVWAHPENFYLNEDGTPEVVAGVPPDYFSKTGQLWGNPLYRWKQMKEDGYKWWVERMSAMLELCDIVRIDHFRGFVAYWEVPATEKTAINGRWVKGPGKDLFKVLKNELGDINVIAEDLGVITPKVKKLRDSLKLPGMKILQFAFGAGPHNSYLPHNHVENCVIYTGTHDNDTTLGWFKASDDKTKDHVRRYFNCSNEEAVLKMMRAVWESTAKYAIVPMQDILGLDSKFRMNTPGTSKDNWEFRFKFEWITDSMKDMLKYHTELFGRGLPEIVEEPEPDEPDPDAAVTRKN